MADAHAHDHAEYHHGEMDISAQAGGYKMFGTLMAWGCVVQGAVLAFLVLNFCTHTGLPMSLIAGVIVLALGGFVLTRKPAH